MKELSSEVKKGISNYGSNFKDQSGKYKLGESSWHWYVKKKKKNLSTIP